MVLLVSDIQDNFKKSVNVTNVYVFMKLVNWQRRQNADEAIQLIASFVEVGRK